MLTFESPVYEIGGIVVFRDHELPSDFYYLCGPPHISKDANGPIFTLLEYRNAVSGATVAPVTRDQLGGAFLILSVDCGLSEAKLAGIKSELSGLAPPGTPDINLTPVLYTKGSADIIALDYQQPQDAAPDTTPGTGLVPPGSVPMPPFATPAVTQAAQQAAASRFVRGVVGSAVPSLLDDLRASFSVSLTPDAAALLEAAYDDDLSPIGVMYKLEFTGLRPALSVKAHGEKQKIYDHLKLAFHAGYTSGSAASSAPATTPPARPVTQPAQQQTVRTQPTGQPTPPATATPPVTTPPVTTPPVTTPPVTTPPVTTPPVTTPPATTPPATTPPATTPPATTPPVTTTTTAPASTTTAPVTTPPATTTTTAPVTTGAPATTTQPATTTPPRTTTTTTTQPTVTQPTGQQTPTGQQAGQQAGQQQNGSTGVALAVDIGYEVEKMVQDETITIEIVRQTQDQSMDQLQSAALDLIKQVITQEFFTPAMTSVPAAAAPAASQFSGATAPAGGMNQGTAGRTGGRVEVGFQLQYKHQEELDTFDIDFSVQAPETRTHAPNGFFSAMLTDVDKATHIRQIDLDDPFFKQIDVTVSTTGDFARYDIESAVVDLQHGGTLEAPVVADAVTFTPTSQAGAHFIAFPDAGDYGVRHRMTYEFGDSPDIAGQAVTKKITTDWVTDTGRELIVHPSDDVSIRSVFVSPGVIDWDVIDKVETTLTYSDPSNSFTASKTYLISASSPRVEWRVRLTDRTLTSYTVQHRWHLKDGARVIEGTAVDSDADEIYVPDPFVERLPILVNAAVDKTNVSRVDVEISYVDKDNDYTVTKLVTAVGPDFVPVSVAIPLMDPDVRKYTYTATLVRVSGAPDTQPAATTNASSIYIVDGHSLDVVVAVLGGLAAAGIDGVQVDLRATSDDTQPQSVLFQPPDPTAPQTVHLDLAADAGSQFQYQTTAFLNSGGNPVVIPWQAGEGPRLTLQAGHLAKPD